MGPSGPREAMANMIGGLDSACRRLDRGHGKTVIMVTRDPKAAAYARRILHLDKGTLLSRSELPREIQTASINDASG
jgi:ABC-type lipoprotein export system ATPase subunit